MTGLGYLQLLDYFLQLRGRRRGRESDYTFNVFHRLAAVEWDTLLFFYGVMMCVGALGLAGYLNLGLARPVWRARRDTRECADRHRIGGARQYPADVWGADDAARHAARRVAA